MNAPLFALTRFIPERLERDRNFQCPAVRRDYSLGLHHDVYAEISPRTLGHDAVLLHSQRIKAEHISAPLVIESVDEYAHVVLAENLIALGYCGAHLIRLVEATKSHIEGPGVI